MSVPTSRTGTKNALISIDHEKCTACGLCVKICKDFSLIIEDNLLKVSSTPLFGCIGCGHCVAVCPHDAILVTGRTLQPEDFRDSEKYNSPDYESVYHMLLNRRSIRDFKNKAVSRDIIDKILSMASTAPMGLPPSDVGVLVLDSKEKVRQFSFEFCSLIEQIKWMFSPVSLSLMRPFLSKGNYLMFKSFISPMISFFTASMKRNEDYLLYDAPLAMMFYGNMSDPADPYIAATYATIAAESMGLGSCMIGSVGPFLKHTGKNFKKKYELPDTMLDSIIVIFGYPQMKFSKTIRRSFKKVVFA